MKLRKTPFYLLVVNIPLFLAITFFMMVQTNAAQGLNRMPGTNLSNPRTYPGPGGDDAYPAPVLITPPADPIDPVATDVLPELATELNVALDDSNGVELTINMPAGMLDEPGALQVTSPSISLYKQRRTSVFNILGQAVDIKLFDANGESITELRYPITITIRYTDQPGLDEHQLVIYWTHDGTSWTPLPTQVDTVNNVMTATVDHLTIFASVQVVGSEKIRIPLLLLRKW